MLRTLLTTTALAALLSTGAMAQNTAGPDLLTQGYSIVDTDGLASKLLGFPIYNSAMNDAERIGEINDLVIGENGQVSAVIVGVGGFLGIGEKNVAVNYDNLTWTIAEDKSERIVLEGASKAQLEAAVAVEMIDDNPVDTAAVPADRPVDDTATGTVRPAAPGVAVTPGTTTAMDPLNRTDLVDFDELTLTAEQLLGTNVYGPNDEHIGTIGDFVLGEGNNASAIDAVIIDFGGFLGIGTKPVAVAFEDLQFFADKNGENRSLVLNVTRDQMEAAPAFNRDTYAADRAGQRIVVDPAMASAG